MSRPAVEGDHRAALRLLAYAVLADAFARASMRLRIRRAFYLSFPEDDFDTMDDELPPERITARMRVIGVSSAGGGAR